MKYRGLSCSLLRFLVFILASCFYIAQTEETDLDICNFEKYEYDILNGLNHLVNEIHVKSISKCEKKCCSQIGCDLFNFTESSGKCQLFSCFDEDSENGTCNVTEKSGPGTLFYRLLLEENNITSSTRSSVTNYVGNTNKAVSCTDKQASECREHEVCIVTEQSSDGYQCNCLSGFIRNPEGTCKAVASTGSESDSTEESKGGARTDDGINDNSSGKGSDPSVPGLTVSLGDDKVLKYPLNKTTIQGTIIPAPSSEVEDVSLAYKWSVVSKPKGDASTLNHKDAAATLSNMTAGVYTVQLQVTKGEGESVLKASDQIDITVKSAPRNNTAPVAIVKPNPVKVTMPNSEAILNGADSTDDYGIVSYAWKEVKRPSTAEPLIIDNSDPSNQILKLSGLVPGEYVVSLTVSDYEGLENTTNVNITVLPATDYPPTANAGADQVITLPVNSITLYGNASTDDKEIVSYKWQNSPDSSSLPADMTGTKTHTLHLSNLEAGTYTFILEVEDSAGQTDTAQVHVIVEEPRDKPPRAVISPEGPRDVYLPDSSVALDASQSSDDNGIKTYAWSIATKPPASIASIEKTDQAVTKLLHLTVEGSYVVKVEVTDTAGQTSSTELTVEVHPDTNVAPVANAGPDLEVHWPVDLLAVSGEESTDDGEIVKWSWIKAENEGNPAPGKAVNYSDSKSILYLSGLVPGTYVYQLTVQDIQAVTSTDTVKIKVVEPNFMPNLIELRLRVPYLQFENSALVNIRRNVAVDLEVNDDEVIITEIGENRQDGNTFVLFYVLDQKLSTVKRGSNVRDLILSKLDAEPKRYTFDSLMVDTYICQNNCSNHGKCNSNTKQCECDGFWMENVIGRWFFGLNSNCDWSVLYFVIIAALVLSCVVFVFYLLFLYTDFCHKFVNCRCRDFSHSEATNGNKSAHNRTMNGSILSAKKIRRRRKRINNNEYIEVAQSGKSSLNNSVEINLSTGENSSDELFTAKPSVSLPNGVHKTNGFVMAKET